MIMSTAITHFETPVHAGADASRRLQLRKLLARARVAWDALGEGFAAARRYEELTRRGLPHQEVAAKVFFEHYAKQ
jgi:hypothetical protein